LPFDIDGIEAKDKEGEFDFIDEPERAVRLVVSLLPPEFQMADCFWYLTSTAGFVKSADVGKGYPKIRLRLMFWLDRPLTCDQIKVWLADYIKEHVTKKSRPTPNSASSTGRSTHHRNRSMEAGRIWARVSPIRSSAAPG
jgi:hypothetical protein